MNARADRPTSDARRLLLAAAVVLGALTIAFTLFVPFYDTNDDTVMRLMAEGRAIPQAGPEPRLLFTNALAGLALVAAYSVAPAVPWYDVALVALLALAAVAMVFVLLRGASATMAAALAAFVATFWIASFVRLQFTIVAGQLAAAGCLLIGEMLMARDPSRAFRLTRGAAAVALIGLAVVVRWQAAALVAAFAAALAAPLVWQAWRAGRHASLRAAAAALVAAAVIAGAAIEADRQYYAADPRWTEYRAAHRLRGQMTEWLPRTAETQKQIEAARQAAGWSANDFEMLRTRFHTNLDTFGADRLDRAVRRFHDAASGQAWFGYPPETLPDAIRATLRLSWTQSSYALAFVLLVALASLQPRLLWPALYGTVLLLAAIVATSIVFKEMPFRLLWPLVTAQAAFFLLAADGLRPRWTLAAAALVLAATAVPARAVLGTLHAASVDRDALARRVTDDVARLTGGTPRIYLLHAASFRYQEYFRPFAPPPAGGRFDFLPLAATSQTPPMQDYLRRAGIRDVALSLCTDDRFRLISDRDLGPIRGFVAEHFGIDVTIEPEVKGQTFTSFRCTRAAAHSPAAAQSAP
jgi:hypothetical protein